MKILPPLALCAALHALRVVNLYEVRLPKCEGNGKDLQALLVFLH